MRNDIIQQYSCLRKIYNYQTSSEAYSKWASFLWNFIEKKTLNYIQASNAMAKKVALAAGKDVPGSGQSWSNKSGAGPTSMEEFPSLTGARGIHFIVRFIKKIVWIMGKKQSCFFFLSYFQRNFSVISNRCGAAGHYLLILNLTYVKIILTLRVEHIHNFSSYFILFFGKVK